MAWPWLALVALLAAAPGVRGLELAPNLQLHGFASQSYLLTDVNDLFGDSSATGGSWEFHELGANLSWRPRADLGLAAQVMSRRAGDTDTDDLRIDYALIDYSPLNRPEQRLNLRLGRVKVPMGLYNETRDVAHTRPSILLPQSVYYESERNVLISIDGGLLNWAHRLGEGELVADLQLGRLREGDLKDLLGLGQFDSLLRVGIDGSRAAAFRLARENWAHELRYGLYWFKADIDFSVNFISPVLASSWGAPGMTLGRELFGLFVHYEGEHWGWASEAQRRINRFKDVDAVAVYGPDAPTVPLVEEQSQIADSFYLQGSYRFDERWQLYARYDLTVSEKLEGLTVLGQSVPNTSPSHRNHARDWTLGLRWDLTRNWMLRGEIHRVDGTAWLTESENRSEPLQRRWNLLALQLAYRF